MCLKLSILIVLASTAASSQLIIATLPDSILCNAVNYVQAATQPQVSNGLYTVIEKSFKGLRQKTHHQ